MTKRAFALLVICAVFWTYSCSCAKKEPGESGNRRVRVVTTLFPLYDFARAVGGDLARVDLLLSPGMEPHSFEPKPADIRAISDADIFLYTGRFMEPWVDDVLKGISNERLSVVDASAGIPLANSTESEPHGGVGRDAVKGEDHRGHIGKDPHIWLDFGNAEVMVRTILAGFVAKDPANGETYRKNAEIYISQLCRLDRTFRDVLATCKKKTIVHGGHFAFGYLARRYGLGYVSAFKGFSPNAEPSPQDIVQIVKTLQRYRLRSIFIEELVMPSVAETISRETSARLLLLHAAHNLSKSEWEGNATFLSLMENNLRNLAAGLECDVDYQR